MPQFQLLVAILLAVSAVCSLVVFYLTQPKRGQIKLHDGGYEGEIQSDPFDITEPEDTIDGHPLDEQGFWFKVWVHDDLDLTCLIVPCNRLAFGNSLSPLHWHSL